MLKNTLFKVGKTLVISPHQDDFIIGCGGLLAKNDGPNGVVFFYKTDNLNETRSSLCCLGIQKAWFLRNIPRETVSSKSLQQIIRIVRSYKPDTVISIENDNDKDHGTCAEICDEAFWLSEAKFQAKLGSPFTIKNIFRYRVWSEITNPPVFVNITSQIKRKLKAIQLHSSQLENFDYAKMIESRGKIYGLLAGCQYAEAFNIQKISLVL